MKRLKRRSGAKLNFEWDDNKAAANLAKHGVSFTEAVTVFSDVNALNFPDYEHSESEQRMHTIGYSASSRILLIVNLDRGEQLRIVSARRATHSERQRYERRN
jgi:uncharacterized protein